MASILGILNIGKLALFAQQRAISVTSQNIANVNTPGYSRQEAVLETTTPANDQPGQIGTGVQVGEIRRLVNRFVDNQVTSEQSNLGRFDIERSILSRVESNFNDAQGTGIHQALTDFFAAVQDLSNNPQGRAERVTLLARADTLAQRVKGTDAQVQQILKDLNSEIVGTVTDVNALASQIADLNNEIGRAEMAGQHANDLRDTRGRLLNDLAQKIDIRTFEDNLGQTTVMVGGGKPLVEGNHAFALRAVGDPDNSGFSQIRYDPGTGTTFDLTSSIGGGRLKGLISLRDNVIPGYVNQLDQLAAGVINEVNQQHRAGYGLDGSTANNFFNPLAPTSEGLSTNTGSGVVSVAVATPASLTFDPYQLSFAGGSYTLQNLTTGTTATGIYSNPTTVTFEGLSVTITGAPGAGDTFALSAHKGSAGSMAVALSDPDKIAAASSAAGVPGDNRNAVLLAQLQDKAVTALGGATLHGFYSGFIGDVGSEAQSAQRSVKAQEIIGEQLDRMRGETSGVSLDEEMTNLIKYQRAFEASARLITVADDLLKTILSMKQ
ncbi:MAG: flagellar hook-associated protein FlgK [Nitrospirae bacterium]|nr:flagellar hook-associated protein FlgK [Nitrospirota bacterium]